MRPVPPPTSSGPLQRSVAASLAAILEVEAADVPVPEEAHPQPWTVWRHWLARRGLGLVPIAEPARFDWPGPWLALLRTAGHGLVGAVAFGAPPGLAWSPLDSGETFAEVELGYLVAPADVALWAPPGERPPAPCRHRRGDRRRAGGRGTAVRVQDAVARAGRGLEGDRYAAGGGTFANPHGRGHDLTLIEAEVLDDPGLPAGLTAVTARRNVVTRGIDLNALVGERFAIGAVECVGQRLCEPCAHLERLVGAPGTIRVLVHRGGLRADVLSDGEIRVGDPVVRLDADADRDYG